MFGWLGRKWRHSPARLVANYERVRVMFGERFPTGGFSSCDFRPHFDGHGHNAFSEILPAGTIEETRAAGYTRLGEMVEFLRPLQPLFGPRDRIQFAVGFPVAVKPANRRMFKGWVPAARLGEVRSPDFSAAGGAFGENEVWPVGLWGEDGSVVPPAAHG
jgi:hypothetical protein